jgi:Fic family protein
MARKKTFDRDSPYNDLPGLPPGAEIETKAVLKRAITATRALSQLNGIMRTIPDPAILINTIVLQEAKSSSEIENVITTTDDLFEAFAAESKDHSPQTKEVLRYREALWEGFNELKKRNVLTTSAFTRIVNHIKANTAGIRKTPGTKIKDGRGRVVYTPPEGERIIRDKLKDLEEFIHSEKNGLDPLIKLPLVHYQFEAIHPFADGNGRTGRIVNILYLVLEGLLDLPILFLSRYIIQKKAEYYRLLRNITEKGEWEAWVLFLLNGIEETADHTSGKVIEIGNLMDETIQKAQHDLPPRVYSKELIELLFRQPYCKVKFIVDAGIAKRQTAAEYLKELERAGVLRSRKSGTELLYINERLYGLLER